MDMDLRLKTIQDGQNILSIYVEGYEFKEEYEEKRRRFVSKNITIEDARRIPDSCIVNIQRAVNVFQPDGTPEKLYYDFHKRNERMAAIDVLIEAEEILSCLGE